MNLENADPWFCRHGQCILSFLATSLARLANKFQFDVNKTSKNLPKTMPKPWKMRGKKRCVFQHHFFLIFLRFGLRNLIQNRCFSKVGHKNGKCDKTMLFIMFQVHRATQKSMIFSFSGVPKQGPHRGPAKLPKNCLFSLVAHVRSISNGFPLHKHWHHEAIWSCCCSASQKSEDRHFSFHHVII